MIIARPLQMTALVACLLLAACAQTPRQPQPAADQPLPQTIRLRADPDAPKPPRGTKDPTIEKDLFNVKLSPKGLEVNGTAVADLDALERLFSAYPKPMITIVAHRCLSGAQVSEVMRLAQEYTETPIPFGSYGNHGDPECD